MVSADGSDALTTRQIEHALKSRCETARFFNGVYSYDTLPVTQLKKKPALVVVNTAYSGSSGEHWQAFYVGDYVEFFDSYGLPPVASNYLDFIRVNGGQPLSFSSKPLQSLHSDTCGKFVCMYLFYKSLGKPLQYFYSLFERGCPDSIVRTLYRKCFGCKDKVSGDGQKCYKYRCPSVDYGISR